MTLRWRVPGSGGVYCTSIQLSLNYIHYRARPVHTRGGRVDSSLVVFGHSTREAWEDPYLQHLPNGSDRQLTAGSDCVTNHWRRQAEQS